jgi:hypothetical protein
MPRGARAEGGEGWKVGRKWRVTKKARQSIIRSLKGAPELDEGEDCQKLLPSKEGGINSREEEVRMLKHVKTGSRYESVNESE